jgi:hypothetical protein
VSEKEGGGDGGTCPSLRYRSSSTVTTTLQVSILGCQRGGGDDRRRLEERWRVEDDITVW